MAPYGNYFPYHIYPGDWPVFIPKDKIANWFESHTSIMELQPTWVRAKNRPGAFSYLLVYRK